MLRVCGRGLAIGAPVCGNSLERLELREEPFARGLLQAGHDGQTEQKWQDSGVSFGLV